MRAVRLSVLLTCLGALPLWAAPFTSPPQGYTLVAEDDCGNPDAVSHVVRGTDYMFGAGMVSGSDEERDIIFDGESCLLRYEKLNPQAAYQVDVVYVTEETGHREQTLEANGLVVHERLALPAGKPGRFLFDVPRAAYADGQPLELKFSRAAGANAVVSYVRLWSTDPHPLPGKTTLWQPKGPIEKDWLRQDRLRGKPIFADWPDPEQELRESVIPCLNEQLARGATILADLAALDVGGLEASRQELAALAQRRDALVKAGECDPRAWLQLYVAARWAVRRLLFKHPALQSPLLFVRRHHANAMHQCARRLGTFTLPGGEICRLDGVSAEGLPTVTSLTAGRFPSGTFGRPDLSFDGRRMVFGFAPERKPEDRLKDVGPISEQTAPLYASQAAGACEPFQVWEVPLDGGAPRKLTEGPCENSDPLYLPGGRIAFMSHRLGGLVQCGDWALAYCVFTMNPGGSDVRQVTTSKDGEWDPFLLADGTIGFTRWEYVMKFWSPIQMVWSVRPDGSNPQIVYGSDLSQTYDHPLNYASARQIPGTSRLVCIGSAHHNTGAGPVCVVDMAKGPNAADGLQRLTPVRYVETPENLPNAGWYDCPYPLSDRYFLVSYSFLPDETATTAYGLYVMDPDGGKELIYRDPELSAMFPTPLRPRPVPPDLPALATSTPPGEGEFLIQDVHEGLAPEARGQARFVQIVQCHERHIHTSPYAIEVGPDSGFETKTVLGTVPVEADGSAFFRVPGGKSVFFSVLDGQHRALNTMRSVTNAQAGEVTSCVGCHESPRRSPVVRTTLAGRRDPSVIQPPEWGARPMEFASVVQPVLDQHCTSCHDGTSGPSKSFDLTTRTSQDWMGVPLPTSYYNLRKYVKTAGMYSYVLPAGSFGSRVSPVTETLLKGHYDVHLSEGEWHRLCAWIDCNAPGIGDYEVAECGRARARAKEAAAARRKEMAETRKVDPARRQALAAALAAGQRLVCYLDCGPAVEDTSADGVTLRETQGTPFVFGAPPEVAAPWYDDISFDNTEVVYEVMGLQPDRQYLLGLSWWDHNNAGRQEAVVAVGAGGQRQQVLGATALPAWAGRNEKPGEQVVALPAGLTRQGSVRVSIIDAGGKSNVVVSEVWLIEQR